MNYEETFAWLKAHADERHPKLLPISIFFNGDKLNWVIVESWKSGMRDGFGMRVNTHVTGLDDDFAEEQDFTVWDLEGLKFVTSDLNPETKDLQFALVDPVIACLTARGVIAELDPDLHELSAKALLPEFTPLAKDAVKNWNSRLFKASQKHSGLSRVNLVGNGPTNSPTSESNLNKELVVQ
ncbi:hypothetical protein [Neptuniibacter sp. QD37_11]|uniref:hypothetical protein n=1 Tax=Neptuniibacter sp. QD37_11 TaxID=3398209 RepID=UPI0039F458DC